MDLNLNNRIFKHKIIKGFIDKSYVLLIGENFKVQKITGSTYFMLHKSISKPRLKIFSSSYCFPYDTWKNQIVKAGFERLKNDGFTNICISETGICDFIESMYDVFAESTGTTANGEVQAIYWDGLLRLIKNDCPYVSDISMWYAEYLNSSSDKVVSVFRKWFNGGVSNG